ncbi:MAG: MFS transporter [Alphaproteobacteria bacterium]|nr:MFS transporter [Alphaproteobacteria bacterium]
MSTTTDTAARRSALITTIVASIAHAYSHLFVLLFATAVLVIAKDWSMSYAELQWLSVPAFVIFGVASLPAGWLGDKWSAPGMIAVFFLGVGASAIVVSFMDSPTGLLLALALMATFAAIYHPVGIPWLVKTATNRGRALGINGVFGNLGTAGAAIVAGFLADTFGWRAAFLVPGIVALLTGVVFLIVLRRGEVVEVTRDAREIPAAPLADIKRAFIALVVAVSCVGLIYQATAVGLPKIFSDRLTAGEGAFGAGLLVSIVYAVSAISQILGGELADRYPLRWVYFAAQSLQVPVIVAAYFTFDYGLVALAVLMVCCNMGSQAPENALVARYTPLAWRSRVYGFKFVLTLGVSTAGVALIPTIHDWTGTLDVLLLMIAGFAVVAAAAAGSLPRERPAAAAAPAQPSVQPAE